MDLPQTARVTQLSVVRDKCHTGGQTNQEKIAGTLTNPIYQYSPHMISLN